MFSLRFCVSFRWTMKKHYVATISQGIWDKFLDKNNRNCNCYKFSSNFAFIRCLSFLRNQKQELHFQQAGDLVTRNTSVFCLYRVALYLKDMSNSLDFCKKIFLHAIPDYTVVPWLVSHELNLIQVGKPQYSAGTILLLKINNKNIR